MQQNVKHINYSFNNRFIHKGLLQFKTSQKQWKRVNILVELLSLQKLPSYNTQTASKLKHDSSVHISSILQSNLSHELHCLCDKHPHPHPKRLIIIMTVRVLVISHAEHYKNSYKTWTHSHHILTSLNSMGRTPATNKSAQVWNLKTRLWKKQQDWPRMEEVVWSVDGPVPCDGVPPCCKDQSKVSPDCVLV